MCTITLSYDQNNIQAQQSLDSLLKTGLFTQLFADMEQKDIDELQDICLDAKGGIALNTFMEDAKRRIPQRIMSLSEAYQVAMGEIRTLYKSDAVSI